MLKNRCYKISLSRWRS